MTKEKFAEILNVGQVKNKKILKLYNETYTIGEIFVDEILKDDNCKFAACCLDHILKNDIEVKMMFKEVNDLNNEIIKDAFNNMMFIVESLMDQFEEQEYKITDN